MTFLTLATAALAIEALVGYPAWLFAAVGHPVTWIGGLIAQLDRLLNRQGARFSARRAMGTIAVLMLLGVTALPCLVLQWSLRATWGFAALAVLAASLPAQRSLSRHVAAVAEALDRDGVEGGRSAVRHIVGRDTTVLDRAGVARAAIESLAENFSDGVVAPAVWLALGGLTGGVLYKAINTADSMVGHRTPRHDAFGWAAARLDDLVNLPASRLAALWIVGAAVVTGLDVRGALAAVHRDARRHRSPNAGWPEAAMAGALGLRLGGPRVYGAVRVVDGFMGAGRADPATGDIRRALKLYHVACGLQWGTLLVATWAIG